MIRSTQRAFTLIEIMIAVAIFSVMSVIAWGALSASLSNAEMLTARMDRLQAVQRSPLVAWACGSYGPFSQVCRRMFAGFWFTTHCSACIATVRKAQRFRPGTSRTS